MSYIVNHETQRDVIYKKSLGRPRSTWDIKKDLKDIGWGKRGLD
jgi:hypothetical protein